MKDDITIHDVARAANVSLTTVSRILNNRPDVSSVTRERVQQVMNDLGYVPRLQAQSLAAGKSRTIALLFPLEHTRATQLELSFVIGASRAAEDEGFYFNLVTSPVTQRSLDHLYRSAQVDGAIIMQVSMEDWRVDYLLENDRDFVMIGRTAHSEELSWVDFDFEHAVFEMFETLYAQGHRHIGFITRPEQSRFDGIGSSVRLYEGFQRAIHAFGLKPLVRETMLTPTATEEAFRELIEEDSDMTAIVTTHGTSTSGVLRAAAHIGIRVPEELSIISIATQKIAETFVPSLTTIDFPSFEMGYEATRIMVQRSIESDTAQPIRKLFSPAMCLRESLAAKNLKGRT